MIKGRKEKIFLGLPDALDLLVVCVEAGLGLDAGMRRVAEEMDDSHPELCQEFNLCNMQLQMGRPRREVLHDLGVRTGVDDVRSLVAILIQADKFGSSIAQALQSAIRQHADQAKANGRGKSPTNGRQNDLPARAVHLPRHFCRARRPGGDYDDQRSALAIEFAVRNERYGASRRFRAQNRRLAPYRSQVTGLTRDCRNHDESFVRTAEYE